MNGLLIVNNFDNSKKSESLQDLLRNSAEREHIVLDVRKTGDLLHNIDWLQKLAYDFVLFWDKDVVLARMLEICGLKVFNSAEAILSCDNKAYTYIKLQKKHIAVPTTIIAPLTYEGLGYHTSNFIENALELLHFPFIIKELYGSFGQQVYLVHNMDEVQELLSRIGYKGFLMQEFIESSAGRDIRINVVGDTVVSAMLRYSVTGDFRSNVSNGGCIRKYEPSKEQAQLAIDACRALSLDFAGVDVLFGEDDKPIICEVNSNPHFKSSLDCTGVDMSEHIIGYIKKQVLYDRLDSV